MNDPDAAKTREYNSYEELQFFRAADKFYHDTHDMIPYEQGENGVTYAAVKSFLPALKKRCEQNGGAFSAFDPYMVKASRLFSEFYQAVERPEREDVLIDNCGHFVNLFETALRAYDDKQTRPKPAQPQYLGNLQGLDFILLP